MAYCCFINPIDRQLNEVSINNVYAIGAALSKASCYWCFTSENALAII